MVDFEKFGFPLNASVVKPNLSIGIGFVGYVCILCYIILSLVYFPSIAGCYVGLKHMTYFMHTAFVAFLLLSLYIIIIDQGETKSLVKLLMFLFVISLSISLVNYFQCGNKNSQVSALVGRMNNLARIQNHYTLLGEDRKPVSRCIGYHDGTYFKHEDVKCIMTEKCENGIICNEDGSGAKLVDFYYASSLQSCMIPRLHGNYVSEEMLRNVIRGGARLVDLDIYANITNKGAYPVVKSSWGGRTPLNFIDIEQCFSVILQEAFVKSAFEDPFFIHLNLKSYNLEMFDRLAETFIRMFPEKNLPSLIYNYTQENIGGKPICLFYNKFILIVSGKFDETKIKEITNISTHYGKDKLRSYREVELPIDPETEIFENRRNFSIVIPNEYNMNTNPGKSWSCGSQFFLMNYGSMDNIMNSHNDFFKKHSCIMKSFALQRKVEIVDTITTS
jgi:hypothetical protein